MIFFGVNMEIEAAQGVGAYVTNVNLAQLGDAEIVELCTALGEFGVLLPKKPLKMRFTRWLLDIP